MRTSVCATSTLRQSAQVIPPIAASLNPQRVASRAGDGLDHVWRVRLIAGAVEHGLNTLRIGFDMISNRPFRTRRRFANMECSVIRWIPGGWKPRN
jgi:hypothetical protein